MIAGMEITRHFSFAEIRWRIKNISLAICPPKMVVKSDEFQISGQVNTVWKMILDIDHDKGTVTLHLKMLSPDCPFRNLKGENVGLRVHTLASILNPVAEWPLTSEKRTYFHAYVDSRIERFKLSDVVCSLPHIEPDELKIGCCMLVNFDEQQVKIPLNVPSGMIELSNILQRVPKSDFYPDFRVKVGRYVFNLHRDMFPGVTAINRLIPPIDPSDPSKVPFINLLNYDEVSTYYFFRYVYSGNLLNIIGEPRIRISEDIERFNLPELKGAYPKEKISLETKIEATLCTRLWRIENFLSNEDCLDGPELNTDGSNSRWQIRMYPRGKNEFEKNLVVLEANLIESNRNVIDVNIEFRSLDETYGTIHSLRDRRRLNVGDKLEIPFFRRDGKIMSKCLNNKDLLILRITIWMSTGYVHTSVGDVIFPPPFEVSNTIFLNLFSRKMAYNLKNPRHCDILLISGKDIYRAHKFVLAARSGMFSSKLPFVKGGYLTMIGLKKQFMHIFLEYLYTGLPSDLEFGTNCYMYEFGFGFKVPHLMERCKHEMKRGNLLKVLKYADDHNLVNIKSKAFEFIVVKIGEDITTHEDWQEFSNTKTILALDLMKAFKADQKDKYAAASIS